MTNTEESNKAREANWAHPVSKLSVSNVPKEAMNLNVAGRQLTGPIKGFGQMWQKTYKIRLSGASASPTEVIAAWKANFPKFWPKGSHFYGPLTGIAPGEVAVLNLSAAGMPLSTGIMVIYADDESFTFMTPEGHMLAAWITFSAHEEDGCSVAQAQVLLRASDPLMELGLRFGGHKAEDAFWHYTLEHVAKHFAVNGQVQQQVTCVDPKLQWSEAKNIWKNAAIRTAFYSPIHSIRKRVK